MKDTLEEIQVRVIEILADLISADKDEVRLESRLYDDLGVDSMYSIELTMDLEEQYNIFIEDTVIGSWVTVQDIANTINKLTNS